MKFNRRGFLASLALPFLAPYLPKIIATSQPLMFKGVPIVFDENMGTGTIGGISRATFSFWRNQPQPSPHDPTEFRRRAEAMSEGMMLSTYDRKRM